ncbi:MAG TPA: DUF1549 and DUF1553 domain-containing protein [Tepidisphaeraceae bacterium]
MAVIRVLGWISCVILLGGAVALGGATGEKPAGLYILTPLIRPEVPSGVTPSTNPIDAFVAEQYREKHLKPVPPADKATLLRRVYLDLIGIPPTVAEQDAFLKDTSTDAYEKVVDRLLASEQHGVRYGRHWLDVLRYADADERMIAAPGIYLWRDWVIRALNEDLPYDQFVRGQLTGYRTTERTQMSATGYRSRVEPRPDDMFALGLLARGQVLRDGKDGQELAISAVDTVSTAFMGLTVGCAKCHNHKFDPISERDFYSMKALFDPLTVRKVWLGTPAEIFASGKAADEAEKRRAAIQQPLEELSAPYKKKLFAERVAMLPPEAQAVILKPEKERTIAEQKLADDYYPIVRLDSDKVAEAMPPAVRAKYQGLQRQLTQLDGGAAAAGGGRRGAGAGIPVFWTVEVDPRREAQTSYILTSGDPLRPELDKPVEPGWPFAPKQIDFRDGRVEAFSDWLTAPQNPMFARVAVNRLWQWHFGEGLQKNASDFGKLSGPPSNPKLLDWLASEFVDRGFSMKQINRLIVTSDVYKLRSSTDAADVAANSADPADACLWHFRLERLEAEPIWDSILAAAGTLDLSVGGPSFDVGGGGRRRGGGGVGGAPGMASASAASANRRAAYMIRGFSTSRDVMPVFLQAFDVDDGRVPCPLRLQTVTAPQGLFMMNSAEIDRASNKFAERLKTESGGDLAKAVDLAYRFTLSREPSQSEIKRSLAYLGDDPNRLKDFAWVMFNLDEFIYVR